MPAASKNLLPTFEEFVKGKYKVKEKQFVGIDIGKIDNYFSTMITEPILQSDSEKRGFKDSFVRNFNRQANPKNSVQRTKNSSPSVHYNGEDQVSQV